MASRSRAKSAAPLGIGLAGRGDVLAAYLANARSLEAEGVVRVVAVVDPEAHRPDTSRPDPEGRYLTSEYRSLLATPGVDAVLVLTSMHSHAALAVAALEAGKHVLLEKPMGVDLDEARQVLECGRSMAGLLVCSPHVLLSPTYQAIARRLAVGGIGSVYTARARYGWSGGWLGHWLDRGAGGALFDLGVYNLTSLTGFLGPVHRVTAMAEVSVPARDVDGQSVPVHAIDNAQLALDFGGGVLAVLTTGFVIERYSSPAIELYGRAGTLQMLGDDWAPRGYEMWENKLGAWQAFPESDPGWRWTDGLRHLADCVRDGTAPLASPDQAYHVLEVMIRAHEAARTGIRQEIDSTFGRPSWAQEGGVT